MPRNWRLFLAISPTLLALPCLGSFLPGSPGSPGVPGASGYITVPYICGIFCEETDSFSFSGTGSGQASVPGYASDGAQVQQTFSFGGNGIDESVNSQISTFVDLPQIVVAYGGLQAFIGFDHLINIDTPSVLHLTESGQFVLGFGSVGDATGLTLTGPGGTLFESTDSNSNYDLYFNLQPGSYDLSGYLQVDEEFGTCCGLTNTTGLEGLSVTVGLVPEPRWISLLAALIIFLFLASRHVAKSRSAPSHTPRAI